MVKNKKNKKEAVLANYDGEMAVFSDKPISQSKESIIDEGNDNVKYNVNKQTLSKKSGRRKRDESTSESNNEITDTMTNIEKIEVTTSERNEKLSRNQGQEHRNDTVQKVENAKASSKKSDFIYFIDDDSNDGENDDDQAQSQAEMNPKDEDCKTAAKETKHGGKKSKKGKRQEKRREEDIEQVLAELQIQYNMGHEHARTNVEIEQCSSIEVVVNEEFTENKKAKKKQKRDASTEVEEDNGIICTVTADGDEVGTLKTATQKKKEKKERQKREMALAKQRAKELGEKTMKMVEDDQPPERFEETPAEIDDDEMIGEHGKLKAAKKDKKKNKKDKKIEVDEVKKETKKKGVSAALVAAMQERLKKIKEEEERQRQMEEELIRQEEERERLRQEALRPELEKKEKKKQREAERKARLKAEGKLLTKKQKEDRARAQAMLEALKAQGVELPEANEKRPIRLGTRIRPKKLGPSKMKDTEEESKESSKSESLDAENDAIAPLDVEEPEVIRDSWDASESDDNGKDDTSHTTSTNNDDKIYGGAIISTAIKGDDSDSENSVEEGDDHFESESMQEGIEKDEMGNVNDADSRRIRAEQRILKRQSEAEKKRTIDDLRAAVVCVLGHVDTGKTKILDKLRRTHVQDSEAGGITQQIGATNVPITAIKDQTQNVRESPTFEFRLPGLLIIDTPGHESFSNLRSRGSSLCDIAILVVDIMHGLEQQTIESLNLLKKRKCPFIVALNKIDRLYNWKVMVQKDIRDVINEQEENTQLEFKQRAKDVTLQFAEHGLNAALFYENPDPRSYVSLVPTSAITGDGMGNLLFLIVDVCQRMLAKRLMYTDELLATVLEVKVIHGFGTTIDVILINGRLREGQTMILAGTDGPIVTQIRSLLMPQPLKELRVKNVYVEYKEVKAAQGVKIAAKDLEKAIAGTNLLIAQKHDEVEICKEEVARELKNALSHIKLAPIGVYVQASTLGSLEALLEFLRTSKIPYASIRIGPVVRRDVMKASTMLEHETQYATILAFDVKIEREAQEMADSLGVKIFQADIIYHLFDKFTAYCDELKQRKREEFRSIAVFPCKLKILPLFIFNTRDPIVMGVTVESGILKVGTPICVPSKEFVDIGTVASIELNHKQIDNARKGQEVCIKIDPLSGESPRMYGRHFDADDILVSRITRQSIDACKDYFRDDLVKADWSLMVELKKIFDIL